MNILKKRDYKIKVYIFAPRLFIDEDLQPHLTPVLSQIGLRFQDMCKEAFVVYKNLDDSRILDKLFLVSLEIIYNRGGRQNTKLMFNGFSLNFMSKFLIKKIAIFNVLARFKLFILTKNYKGLPKKSGYYIKKNEET